MRLQQRQFTQRQKLYVLCGLCVALVLFVAIFFEPKRESSQQPTGKLVYPNQNRTLRKRKSNWPPAWVRPTQAETDQRYKSASTATKYHASRLKLLALAAIQFSLDHDDRLAFRNQNFHQKLLVYGGAIKENRLEKLYTNNQKKYPYSFNDHIIGVNREKLTKDKSEMAWTTIMFYEGRNGKLDFVHRGYALVCFVPGQVWLINRQEAKSLRWEFPAKFKH